MTLAITITTILLHQAPVGAGLAFAAKYATPEGQPSPIAVACYGDGAANQVSEYVGELVSEVESEG